MSRCPICGRPTESGHACSTRPVLPPSKTPTEPAIPKYTDPNRRGGGW